MKFVHFNINMNDCVCVSMLTGHPQSYLNSLNDHFGAEKEIGASQASFSLYSLSCLLGIKLMPLHNCTLHQSKIENIIWTPQLERDGTCMRHSDNNLHFVRYFWLRTLYSLCSYFILWHTEIQYTHVNIKSTACFGYLNPINMKKESH